MSAPTPRLTPQPPSGATPKPVPPAGGPGIARRAVIALGGNLGDREAILRAAVRDIAGLDGVVPVAVSGLVETPALRPHGVDREAPAYLNAVLIVRTSLDPLSLLDALNDIEQRHGRLRGEHGGDERWGDRTLDLDIVAVDGVTEATARLTLPHPRAWQRAFVLAPWLQADPDAVLTGHGLVADLLAAASDEVLPLEAAPLLGDAGQDGAGQDAPTATVDGVRP